MKRESLEKVKIDPPNWKEVATKSIRESFPAEYRAKALDILKEPKTEKLLRMMLAEHGRGNTVDFTDILYRMASDATPYSEHTPMLLKDRDEIRHQAKVAKQLHRRMTDLVVCLVRDPNISYHVHKWSWPIGTAPKTPRMTDATILWALETVSDYLKAMESEGPRTRSRDLNKHGSIIGLEKELRKARMKGKGLYSALALAYEITHGKTITVGSAKTMLMTARSILPQEPKTGKR
jgi:hypothetical protein